MFAVEQAIAYNDLVPAIDHLATTTHCVVFADDGEVLAYLRTYPSDDGRMVGRVASASRVRGMGLGKAVMDAMVANESGGLAMLAQAYLEGFYSRWGFERSGEPYLHEEIIHVWMERR